MHSTGKYGKWVPEKLKELGVNENKASNVVIREYIDDMDVCLAASDLVIGRAGASSLSEMPKYLNSGVYIRESRAIMYFAFVAGQDRSR